MNYLKLPLNCEYCIQTLDPEKKIWEYNSFHGVTTYNEANTQAKVLFSLGKSTRVCRISRYTDEDASEPLVLSILSFYLIK